jgi:CRISPR-associated protein Csx17
MTAPYEVRLTGCHPRPLASYLKAVGVLRLIAEQVDPHATVAWEGDDLVLRSTLHEDGLRAFFADQYRPTPVISPWNGGSGFYPGDNQSGIGPMSTTDLPRFAHYAETIRVARGVLAALGIAEKGKEDKARLLDHLRAELPDAALAWLDAAVLLTADGLKFPPLLGTGGNDGRLDFSNNYMQRLWALEEAGPALRRQWIDHALLGHAIPRLLDASVGQFLPASAGGYNTGFGFDAASRINPWDFILLVEGALAFAAAAVRKLEGAEASALVFPFMVRSAGAGYASASDKDEGSSNTRDELWLPLWSQPSTWRELRQVFGEGRALVSAGRKHRAALSALDFARALGDLGVDRGIHAFERYGFHVRNGLSYLAVPLGRWTVTRNASASRLAQLDAWLERFRRATGDGAAPASLRRVRRALDEAVLAVCAEDAWPQRRDLLVSLGHAELQMNRSLAWVQDKGVGPVPWLDVGWLPRPGEAGPEERLALALASDGLRGRFSRAVGDHKVLTWSKVEDRGRVWVGADLVADLAALLQRRDVEANMDLDEADVGRFEVGLADVAAFLDGATDDARIADLAVAFSLFPRAALASTPRAPGDAFVPALYGLLQLVHDPSPLPLTAAAREDALKVPHVPGLIRRALVGDAVGASRLAARRLRASGVPAALFDRRRPEARDVGIAEAPDLTRRIAVALSFPLSRRARADLVARTLTTPADPQEKS